MSKVALVTGASSGIGLDTALRLCEKGFKVYGAARRVELIKPLEEKGGEAVFLDITKEDSVRECVSSILEKEGRIDLLVNNAGFGLGGAVEDVPLEEVRRQFEVNLFGLAEITKQVLPTMRNQGSGRIVNISSMAGRFSSPFLGWYHATKYSVEAFSDALRLEVKPFGIKVSIIEPGLIKTDWGVIAAKNIRKYSESSAYKNDADSVAGFYERNYSKDSGISEPSVISKAIVKAATRKNPKIRYSVGRYSKLFIWLKKHIPERFYDFALLKVLKRR